MQVNTKLGEILVAIGWLTAAEIDDALATAQEMREPLGQVLVLRGRLSSREVQMFILAQSLLRDGYIELADARRALTISSWSGLSLEDSLLIFLGRNCEDAPSDNRLGQLLLASCCIDAKCLEHSLSYCGKTGLALGRVLVRRKHITRALLNASLAAQNLVRSGKISIDLAIGALSQVNTGMELAGSTGEELSLGSLLVHAGVLQSQTLTQVLEEALATVKPLGQVLLDWHLLTPTLLDIALRLQVLLEQGRIRSRRAIKALSIAFGNGCSLNEALASIADPPGTGVDISLAFFLKHTGLFAPWLGELDSIDQSGLENKDQLQFLSAFVETQKLAPAIRCAFLLRNGLLSFEEALLAYHCSLLSGQDIGDFLADIGWVEAATMQAVAHRRAELTVVPGQTAA